MVNNNSESTDLDYIENELTRICNLLEFEKPVKVTLKNYNIKPREPKITKNGKEIILFKPENISMGYTQQISKAYIKILKKRPKKWIYRNPSLILGIMTAIPISFLLLIAFLYQFGLFSVIFGTLTAFVIHLYISHIFSFVFAPQIKAVAESMVKIGVWEEDKANLTGKNYHILEASMGMICMVSIIMFLMLTGTPPP